MVQHLFYRRLAANENSVHDRLIDWVQRLTKSSLPLERMGDMPVIERQTVDERRCASGADDWDVVEAICGHSQLDFAAAGAPLPLTASEIQYFCRNHRDCDATLSGQFEASAVRDLPEPLAVLYSIYLSQMKIDAEAALFLAQASGSVRVARVMADLLAIGAFTNGTKSVFWQGAVYAVAAAFDTSAAIDAANQEASKRLALDHDHPAHLLRLPPDDIGLLAAQIVRQAKMSPEDMLRKAALLAEARQDVNRFESRLRYRTALLEGDLPASQPWTQRLLFAYRRQFPAWFADLPIERFGDGQNQISA